MARLSPKQLASAAYQAGFRGQALAEAVSIAMAESQGNPNALNPNGEHSVGLMQMNMNAHGTRFGTEAQLRDPVHNMKAAYQLSQGGKNFRPWSVHRSSPSPHAGASDRHLGEARAAAEWVSGGQIKPVPRGGGGGGGAAARQAEQEAQRQREELERQREAIRRRQEEEARIQEYNQRANQLEQRTTQESQAHQERMLRFMNATGQGQRGAPQQQRRASPMRVNAEDFSSAGFTERLENMQPDLTPAVQRSRPDRQQMLMGMGRQIQQQGR